MRSIKVVSSSQKAPGTTCISYIRAAGEAIIPRVLAISGLSISVISKRAPFECSRIVRPQVNHLYSPKVRRTFLRERAQSFRRLRPAMTEETMPEWHIQRLAVARRAMPVPSPAASRSLQIPNQRSAAGTVGLLGLPPRSRIIETKPEPLPQASCPDGRRTSAGRDHVARCLSSHLAIIECAHRADGEDTRPRRARWIMRTCPLHIWLDSNHSEDAVKSFLTTRMRMLWARYRSIE